MEKVTLVSNSKDTQNSHNAKNKDSQSRVDKAKILVIDDDPDNLLLVSKVLAWEGYDVRAATNGQEAMTLIDSENLDLVLLDITLPDLDPLKVVPHLRNKEQYVSVIFLSVENQVDDVIRGLDIGADDYIPKPFDPRELLARTRSQLRTKKLHDDLKSANNRLKELVNIDDLTGLFNMRSLYDRLDNELVRARRFGRQIAVLMMDMDYFKGVNDQHDHLFGSFVLSEVGQLIRQNMRSHDFAARYGGDEFLIVLTESDLMGTQLFAERLREKIAAHVFTQGNDAIQLTASLGFAILEPSERSSRMDARELVRRADRALFRAKDAGRNCVYYDDLSRDGSYLKVPWTKNKKRKIVSE